MDASLHGAKQEAPSTDKSNLEWALFYASLGWLVLPLYSFLGNGAGCSCNNLSCRSPGKHPRTAHGVRDASKDPQQVRAWWREWPDANIGIATGATSGIVVLDIDPRNGGDESYAKLQEELPGAFTQLLKVRSGSNGTHLYYQHPGGNVPCRTKVLPGIDIRSDGGHVVAPPSRHASGNRYRFAIQNGFVVPVLASALRDLILPQAQARTSPEGGVASLDSLRVSDDIKELIREGKPKGKRSEADFKVIRALVKAGHDDATICAVLMDPVHGLSDKPRELGAAWLEAEIKRARSKPDRAGTSQSSSQRRGGGTIVSRRASEIEPEPINWLWPQRIALGKNSLIAGLPGLGKSQITTYLAAITSSGGTWATGEECVAGDVLILSAEDDPADTIRPRLEAAGANLDRVHIIEAVRDERGERSFNLNRDLDALAMSLAKLPDAKLAVIDPISAYLGGIDSHKNAEVRGTLAPLAKLAADHGVAFMSVTHLNKSPSTEPLTRVIGSMAFVAAVRTAFLVQQCKVNPERRLFLPLKNNISRSCHGLAFRIETHVLSSSGIATSRVAWEAEPVTITASEALSQSRPEEIAEAKEIISASVGIL